MALNPTRILVIKIRAMGDTVLMAATLQALHREYPRARIDVCVTAAWAPLLQGIPGVAEIIAFERRSSRRARLRALMKTGFALRTARYDTVLCLHASPSSAALALATGAKRRAIHFHGHHDRNRYSTVEIPGKGVLKPIIERDLDTVRALGITIPEGSIFPRLELTPSERKRTGAEALGLTTEPIRPILGIALGASRPTKRWDTQRWAQIAARWLQERGGSVVAIASQQEKALKMEFETACKALLSPEQKQNIHILGDRIFSVRELATVISKLSVLAGNDSGPRHLAAALHIPTVTLFGPEDPLEWHPYLQTQHPIHFVPHLPCRRDAEPGYPPWCGIDTCTVEKHRCMGEISVDQVWKTLSELQTEVKPKP